MVTIRHYFKNEKEIYTAIYLDDILLVDWTGSNSITEINELHPAIKEAEHINTFVNE